MSGIRCLADCAIRLSEKDNVVTALVDMPAGPYALDAGGEAGEVVLPEDIPAGFKVALAPIAAGAEVVKYGYTIGTARADIRPGDRVHVHNMASSV